MVQVCHEDYASRDGHEDFHESDVCLVTYLSRDGHERCHCHTSCCHVADTSEVNTRWRDLSRCGTNLVVIYKTDTRGCKLKNRILTEPLF